MSANTDSRMSVKSAVTLIIALFLVVVLARTPIGERVIAISGEAINGILRGETQDRVIFTITFDPPYREEGVHVVAMVEGVEIFNDLIPRSGFPVATWIPKGAMASVMAQQTTHGKLACTAQLNGEVVDRNARPDIGSTRCYVNRRTRG